MADTVSNIRMVLAKNKEILGRDAFDIVAASELSPPELREALAEYVPRQIRMLSRTYRTMNGFLTADTKTASNGTMSGDFRLSSNECG